MNIKRTILVIMTIATVVPMYSHASFLGGASKKFEVTVRGKTYKGEQGLKDLIYRPEVLDVDLNTAQWGNYKEAILILNAQVQFLRKALKGR